MEPTTDAAAAPILVLVTGPPGSGKTTIAVALRRRQPSLARHSKDALKEALFDSLGWSDRTWSKKVGAAAFAIADQIIADELRAGHRVILDANLDPERDVPKIRDWQQRYGCHVIQIVCTADAAVLFERFSRRARSGHRHPGHADDDNLDEWREYFLRRAQEPQALNVPSMVFHLDTTDLAPAAAEAVLTEVDRALAAG